MENAWITRESRDLLRTPRSRGEAREVDHSCIR